MARQLTVRPTGGVVRGRGLDGHAVFYGIPYAAPPTGRRRWRAPAPVTPWTGVRDATEPVASAPQPAQPFAETSVDEDCLTLTVTAPDTEREGLPVVVWLHGGGGTNGTGSVYGAGRLAESGDVVVVTPNFRLGALACFGHPGLPDGGAFGLLDQQAVLRWVRHEIAHFGGDPDNVTLAGDSHGALQVAAHLVAPGSAGLFHRAVLHSPFSVVGPTPAHLLIPGVPALPPMWTSAAELERSGAAAALDRGWCAPDTDPTAALEQLRRLPVSDLLAVSDLFIRPAFGGAVLPESPAAAIPAGRFHRVPVLLGTTRDEARFFVGLFADAAGRPVTAERYPRLLTEAFGDAAELVADRYPLDHAATPSLAWARVCTDRAWARPAWELAQALTAHTRTWFFQFADRDAPPIVPGAPTGAHHGNDLPYLFDLPGAGALPDAQRELADGMLRCWTAFAEHGDPAHPGLPDWPDVSGGHVQALAPERIGGVDYVAEHRLDFWAGLP